MTYPIRINFTILMTTAGHRWNQVTISALILLYLAFIVLLLSSGCVRHDAGFIVRPEAFLDIPDIYADEATSHVTMSVGGYHAGFISLDSGRWQILESWCY